MTEKQRKLMELVGAKEEDTKPSVQTTKQALKEMQDCILEIAELIGGEE